MPTADQNDALVERVKDKLGPSLLLRLEGAKRIRRQWQWRMYSGYRWTHELALALVGIGISHPLVLAYAGTTPEGHAGEGNSVLAGVSQLPWYMLGIVVLAAACWVILKTYVQTNKTLEVVPLYQACANELGVIESELDEALNREEPVQRLSELQAQAKSIVDRYYKIGGWPWPIGPDGCDSLVSARADDLCRKYSAKWRSIPDIDRRRS